MWNAKQTSSISHKMTALNMRHRFPRLYQEMAHVMGVLAVSLFSQNRLIFEKYRELLGSVMGGQDTKLSTIASLCTYQPGAPPGLIFVK